MQDVPTGYAVDPSPSSNSDKSGPCQKAPISASIPSVAKVEVQFTKSQVGPFLLEQLVSYSGDGAQRAYEAAKQLFSTCTSWTTTGTDGTATSFTASALSFPKLGDQTLALRLNGDDSSTQVALDLVAVRKGNVICVVAGLGTTSILGSNSVDPAVLATTARTAVNKISAVPAEYS